MKQKHKHLIWYWAAAIILIIAIGVSVLNTSLFSAGDKENSTVQVRELLTEANGLVVTDKEKARELLKEAVEIASRQDLEKVKPFLSEMAGKISLEDTDYPQALEDFIKTVNYYKELPELSIAEKTHYARVLGYTSQVYFLLNRNEKALNYLKESLSIYENLDQTEDVVRSYRNLGSIYYNQGKYEEALEAYQHLLDIDTTLVDPKDKIVLYSNLGAVNFSLNRPESSIQFINKAEKEITKQLEKNSSNRQLRKLLSRTLYNKAVYYRTKKDDGKYLEYLKKSLEALDTIYAPAETYPILLSLQQVYRKNKEYKKAYDYLLKSQAVKDSLFNIESNQQIANLEVQQQIFQEQQVYERQKRQIERIYWIALAILMGGIVTVLFYLNLQKNRIIRTEKEKQQLAEKKQILESHIDKQELILTQKDNTMQQLSLSIEEKEQNILSLEEKIQQINSTLRKHIHQQKVTGLIKHHKPTAEQEEERKELLLSLEQLSIPLIEKLEVKFGRLTQRQKQLSALIKHDFTAKEAAILFNISHKSVQTAKYRLKKTFGLKPEEQLENFLKEL